MKLQSASSLNGVRVVLLGEYAETGGARVYFDLLLQLLSEHGAKLTVFHPPNIPPTDNPELSPTYEWEALNCTITYMQRLFRNPLGYALESLRLYEQIRRVAPSADVIIESVTSPGRFLPIRAPFRPVLQIQHSYPRGHAHRMAGAYFGKLAQRYTTQVGVSDFLSDSFRETWRIAEEAPFITIPNSVGPAIIPETDVPRSSDPETSRPVSVLCVGSLTVEKNPLRFIRIAEALSKFSSNDFKFTWVGSGPLALESRSEVESRSLGHLVEFVGEKTDVTNYYEGADIYLQLSAVDSMPLATLEAMKHGIPSIVSTAGGLPDLVKGAGLKLAFDPDEDWEIVRLLDRLATDSVLYKRLSQAQRMSYQDNYSYEIWEKSIVSSIRGLVEVD